MGKISVEQKTLGLALLIGVIFQNLAFFRLPTLGTFIILVVAILLLVK